MFNVGQMMKQVQEMQGKMTKMQERLVDMEATGQAGGGLVEASLSGKGALKKIKIDPSLVDPAEIEMLEDMVVAAVGDAKAKMDEIVAGETEKVMGGAKLPPGMSLPF
ncbi:MAG TPA: YbaB/EbfC family nucleoid-associated protein [Rhodospirillaceae bacterium]|nr:YbaB/EbfC family nucleoid-associated protein [Rhodospirillaceae bacterium]